MKRIITNFFVGLTFLFLLALPTSAQTDWVISDFRGELNIQNDGTLVVGESIFVNFFDLEKHGIYRDLPLVYEDENGQRTYSNITVNLVTQDGEMTKYKVSKEENNLRIRIGDPNRTINGIHHYEITYTVTGVLRGFAEHDELYWNVTGSDWEADIENASAIVRLPKGEIMKTACFEGYIGYTNPCKITPTNATEVMFTATRNLPPTQELTIAVGYPKGLVPLLTVPPPKKLSDDIFTPLSLFTFIFSLVGGIGGIVWLWITRGRDFWFRVPRMLDPKAREEVMPISSSQPIVVEFEPPENLRPAEIGVLMDERADTLDVTATIIDLANRGFLTIKEIDKKWLFGSKDYELHKTATAKDKLLPYEKLLLDRLFESGNTVKISSLKTKFYDDLAEVKKKLYEDVVDKKLFPKNPDATRNKYTAIGVGIVCLSFIYMFAGITMVSGPLVTFSWGTIISGVIFILASRSMSRRSAIGRELYQRAKGYHLFISGAEKYRQQFYEKKNMFNEILPYAIVLGLTGKFAKAMKDMGIQPTNPTWYTGTHAFTPTVFASDVNSFSKSLSTAITSTPSKSGGFSGGSSGGGFGGGGGGSW